MGTWGYGILQDDSAADVHADYVRLFQEGTSHPTILKKLRREFDDLLEEDEAAVTFWLAVAAAQWDCGALQPAVLRRVEKIVTRKTAMRAWEGSGGSRPEQRQRVVTAFLAKLKRPNPKPRRPRKPVRRTAVYRPGDCLAFRFDDGDYGAALVLARRAPAERPRVADDDCEDVNLIGVLRYKKPTAPDLSVFAKRKWLMKSNVVWKDRVGPWVTNVGVEGHRAFAKRLSVVGHVPLRDDDPSESPTFSTWNFGNPGYQFAKGKARQNST